MKSFLKCTIDHKRALGALSLNNMTTWVDVTYAAYNKMCSQTGGVMTLGNGVIQGRLSKQKLNAKSSTEVELVGASEFLPYNIWMNNFL
mgnify:CR=1 FL=1